MNEINSDVDAPKPNIVSEYVLSKVDKYDELDAPTLEEGDIIFRNKLVSAIKESNVGTIVGNDGLNLLVQELSDNEQIVVKRLRNERYSGYDIDEFWEDLQSQHAIIDKYFGTRFVPYTEFISFDGSLAEVKDAGIQLGWEHVMVQEKLRGEKYSPGNVRTEVSPKLKEEVIEFIRRYETMIREEKAKIDDQIMINYSDQTVQIYDTNGLAHMDDQWDSGMIFLQSFGIDTSNISTTDDILDKLVEIPPPWEKLLRNIKFAT